MECGVSCDEFWEMSYGDILDTIEAVGQRILHEQQRLSGMIFRLVNGVALGFNDPKRLPRTQSEMFPELFKSENEAQDWRMIKENMERYKTAHNGKFLNRFEVKSNDG